MVFLLCAAVVLASFTSQPRKLSLDPLRKNVQAEVYPDPNFPNCVGRPELLDPSHANRVGSGATRVPRSSHSQLPTPQPNEQIKYFYFDPCWDLDGAGTWHGESPVSVWRYYGELWDAAPEVRLILDPEGHVWAEVWGWLRPERFFAFVNIDVSFTTVEKQAPLRSAIWSDVTSKGCEYQPLPPWDYAGAPRRLVSPETGRDLWTRLDWAMLTIHYVYRMDLPSC